MRKCRKCGAPAVIYMRQHRLALCKEHYLEWFVEQTERTIKRYHMFTRQDRVLVAVSGGKDSLALWDVLWRLGYQADGLYIGLGIDGGIKYSAQSHALSEQFARERGLRLIVVDIPETYGISIPELARRSRRGRGKPCAVCGLVKRHEMNRIAHDMGYNVLATGHNLDDEAAVLFGNVLQWQMGYIVRQGPVLPEAPGLARKVKPLVRFYERETAAYALLRGIQYIYDECPFAEGATSMVHKELLNRLEEERPGAKLQFYVNFLKAKAEGWFRQPEPPALHRCDVCGQPTTAPGMCAFCRTMARAGIDIRQWRVRLENDTEVAPHTKAPTAPTPTTEATEAGGNP
ncbi:MAG: adenine nucleotide alpha hydrolase family protein [Chloroflexi bacterium]|nr:adenine nucleotide alpha hydrolase family protein [Chloroflexota bacterium]